MSVVVPVVWWNVNPDAIARGYWDQGLLEDLFSGAAWSVPDGFEYVHYEAIPGPREAPSVFVPGDPRAGAVVVVPARQNVHHAKLLIDDLTDREWAVVILTGDEGGEFPFEELKPLERVTLWVMSPQPNRNYGGVQRLLGSGYPPGIREVLATVPPDAGKPCPWVFMGQVTHERRHDCRGMLIRRSDGGLLLASEGFTQGAPQEEYWLALAASRIAPCPSGPLSPDSFRTYEALEAGCVPLADDATPDGMIHQFWRRVLRDPPFPTVTGPWRRVNGLIDHELSQWPRNANAVFAWWQQQKRELAWQLHDSVAARIGDQRDRSTPAVAITPIVVSSPTPHHPSTEHLEILMQSLLDQLPGAEIVLAFDGVRPELDHRRADYEEYVRRALWLANTRWPNVVPVVADDWLHQANLTRLALEHVRTRLLLFMEHDTPLTGAIDWPGIVSTLDSGQLDMVRLHHETAIGPHHEHVRLDATPQMIGGVPIVRTYQWSQRPHVAQVGWYRDRVLARHFAPSARTMIEDVMHGVCSTAWAEFGLAGWERFRLGLYAPDGNMQRSLHLDSRRLVVGEEESGDPKFPMLYAYPDGTPDGAPQPGRR